MRTQLFKNKYKKGKERRSMNENEKRMLETITKALPEMSERQQYYLLGVAEGMAEAHKKKKEEPTEKAAV